MVCSFLNENQPVCTKQSFHTHSILIECLAKAKFQKRFKPTRLFWRFLFKFEHKQVLSRFLFGLEAKHVFSCFLSCLGSNLNWFSHISCLLSNLNMFAHIPCLGSNLQISNEVRRVSCILWTHKAKTWRAAKFASPRCVPWAKMATVPI